MAVPWGPLPHLSFRFACLFGGLLLPAAKGPHPALLPLPSFHGYGMADTVVTPNRACPGDEARKERGCRATYHTAEALALKPSGPPAVLH